MISAVDIAWTGGNPYDANIVASAANGCYRPIDPDKARKVEDKCVQPLPEARKLQVIDTTVTKKQAPLTQWMKDVSGHLKSNGMDGVFYADKSNQAVGLLNNWSQMDMNEVTEWYKQEQWDNYDQDNLRMSGKFLCDLISNKIWQRILFAIQGHEVGPLIYAAVVRDMQQVVTVAARIIVDEMRKLHIYDIP